MKPLIPHLIAFVVFFVLVGIYFSPALDGKVMKQHDIVMAKSMQQEINTYKEKGETILWTNAIFSGMPAYLIWMKYPANVITYVMKYVKMGYLPQPIGSFFVYFLGMYILLIVLKIRPEFAFIGGLAFAFSSYNIINVEAGHLTKALAVGFAPMVLAGIILILRKNYLFGLLLTTIAMGLEIRANHFQITYYLLIVILILMIFEFVETIKEKKYLEFFKAVGIIAIGLIIGVTVNITSIWVTQEYSHYSMRGGNELDGYKSKYYQKTNTEKKSKGLDKTYAYAWSYGVGESMTLLIPNAAGGGTGAKVPDQAEFKQVYNNLVSQNMKSGQSKSDAELQAKRQITGLLYWGNMSTTSGPIYIGAIMIFLFVFGMFLVKGKIKWWLFTATVLALLLSWGKNFPFLSNLFFDYFPMYNKFRVPMTLLLVVSMTVPILSLLSLDGMVKGEYNKEEIFKALKYSTLGVGGLVLLALIVGAAMLSFETSSDAQLVSAGLDTIFQDKRKSMFTGDAFRSLFFIAVVAGSIYYFLKDKLKLKAFMAILAIAVLVDMWGVDFRYLNKEDFYKERKNKSNNIVQPRPVDQIILQDPDPDFRVMDMTINPWNEASPAYFHKFIGGYHGAKMSRYQDMIEWHLNPELQKVYSSLTGGTGIQRNDIPIYNMLNTKYFIALPQANGAVPNNYALGNAWFVHEYQYVDTAVEEMLSLINYDKLDTLLIMNDSKNDLIKEKNKLEKELTGDPVFDATTKARLDEINKSLSQIEFRMGNLKNFDPAQTAIINNNFEKRLKSLDIKYDSSATIKLEKYHPDLMTYKSNTTSNQLAVFSEIYYDAGWNAYLDGNKVPYFRADYILRAMVVPAGEHTIEFKFEPKSYYTGEKISGISSIFIILILLSSLYFYLRKPKEEASEE